MMKIAICDDCQVDIESLKELIKSSTIFPAELEFYEFLSGEGLLADFAAFDVIFLDMQMGGGMNGVRTAEEIRKRDPDVLLSYYSGYEMPANQILQVRPFQYLIKDTSKEELALTLQTIFEEIEKKRNRMRIHATYNGKVFFLQISDIIYISILNKGSELWLTKKKSEEIWGKDVHTGKLALKSNLRVSDYYKMLQDKGFAYANKSYIINVEHIRSREKNTVLLSDGSALSVTRGMKKEFDDKFCKYIGL